MGRDQILSLTIIILVVSGGLFFYTQADDRAYKNIREQHSEKACLDFIFEYGDSEYMPEVLEPHSSGVLTLARGDYRIAASVDASSVRSFAGSEQVEGGAYEVEYYIQTSRH